VEAHPDINAAPVMTSDVRHVRFSQRILNARWQPDRQLSSQSSVDGLPASSNGENRNRDSETTRFWGDSVSLKQPTIDDQ
jgi:hypothetical protein